MSCFGPVSAGRSPVFVRPTTGALSRHSCGLCYCCLASACVLLPEQREVVLHTRLPRGGHLRVSHCGQTTLVALPRGAVLVYVPGAIKAASLALLVSDVAHDIGSWPFWLPRPDPKALRN